MSHPILKKVDQVSVQIAEAILKNKKLLFGCTKKESIRSLMKKSLESEMGVISVSSLDIYRYPNIYRVHFMS